MSCVEIDTSQDHSIDRAALVRAFRVAIQNYNPYRRNCEPSQDSFWQIISGGRKLGLLNDEFKTAHNVSEDVIADWENRRALPKQRQRGNILADLRAATAQLA